MLGSGDVAWVFSLAGANLMGLHPRSTILALLLCGSRRGVSMSLSRPPLLALSLASPSWLVAGSAGSGGGGLDSRANVTGSSCKHIVE